MSAVRPEEMRPMLRQALEQAVDKYEEMDRIPEASQGLYREAKRALNTPEDEPILYMGVLV